MKRFSALCILFLILAASVAAAPANPSSDPAYEALTAPFEIPDTRFTAMGDAGLALARGTSALYVNPAGLADGKLDIDLPSISITMFNPARVLTSGVIQDLTSGGQNAVDKGLQFLESLGVYNKIMQIDASAGFTAKGFGFGFAVQDIIHTYNGSGSSAVSSSVLNQINAVLSIGYGYRFDLPMDYSIDVGAAVRFNYIAYTKTIGAGSILGMISGSGNPFDSILQETPMMAGFSIPIDIGVTANMPLGFSVSLAARNINGRYYMTAIDSISSWQKNPFGSGYTENGDLFGSALDFVDLIGFKDHPFNFRGFMGHVNIGAELEFVNSIALRIGLAGGYLSLGVGFDLHVLKVDLSYYWREYGEIAGAKGVDACTLNFTLGW